MSATVSIRLSETLTDKLDHIALETERSRSFHIQKALESYLEDYADLQIAIDRLRDKSDPALDKKDFRKYLGL